MKHAMFLMFGLCAAGCGSQASDIPPGTVVEARLIEHKSTGQYCTYMLPDGSEVEYDRYYDSCTPVITETVEE